MNRSLAVLLSLLSLAVACDSDSPQDLTDALVERYAETHPVDELPFRDGLAESGFLVGKFSGEWRYEDGNRLCKGFLTRSYAQDFCAADVPMDWQPFTYDGKTYFVQPLSVVVKRNDSLAVDSSTRGQERR